MYISLGCSSSLLSLRALHVRILFFAFVAVFIEDVSPRPVVSIGVCAQSSSRGNGGAETLCRSILRRNGIDLSLSLSGNRWWGGSSRFFFNQSPRSPHKAPLPPTPRLMLSASRSHDTTASLQKFSWSGFWLFLWVDRSVQSLPPLSVPRKGRVPFGKTRRGLAFREFFTLSRKKICPSIVLRSRCRADLLPLS